MSSWVALNIEPDEAIEEEVDDTKEIQIEEALKLYQTALKLHSQGPEFYREAENAYHALLHSEIFNYPESISDFNRAALQDSEAHPSLLDDSAAAETLGEYDINDSTSSTLLQTIYLSYKNHGQYLLDSLHHILQTQPPPETPDAAVQLADKVSQCSNHALERFAEALEKDDTDLDLWRRSARLSSALQSYRLVRYCLESVLADDENRLEVRAEQMGLDETLAQERLRETLQSLSDRLSVSQIPLKKPKKALLSLLSRQTDPYPYLPALPDNLENVNPTRSSRAISTARHVIVPSAPTWDSVGQAILQLLIDEESSTVDLGPGAAVRISLPAPPSPAMAPAKEETQQLDEHLKPSNGENESKEQKDVEVLHDSNQPAAIKSPSTVKLQGRDHIELPEDQSSVDKHAEKQLMEGLEDLAEQAPEAGPQQQNSNADELDPKLSITASRKRSSASAANEEHADGARTKSRRTRARESNAESLLQTDEVAFDQTKYYEDRLEIYVQADEWMFETVGSLWSKIGVEELGTIEQLRKTASLTIDQQDATGAAEELSKGAEALLSRDLRDVMKNWNDEKARAATQGDSLSALQNIQGGNRTGLAIFLEHSKKSNRKLRVDKVLSGGDRLPSFINTVNEEWCYLQDVTFGWLKGLLMPEYGKYSTENDPPQGSDWPVMSSTYESAQWPESLKETVVQILLREDESIYKRLCDLVSALEKDILDQTRGTPFKYNLKHFSEMVMVQAIFELHLDMYAMMNNPNSAVIQETRILQRDRLARWAILARTCVNHFMDCVPAGDGQDNIVLRHLWASTFHSNMAVDAQREHVLLCLHDLKHVLQSLGSPVINLVNNAIMPEISVGAIDQEISKLNSMDFFTKIFSPESEDPVDLIETLEPILEPSSVEAMETEPSGQQDLGAPSIQVQEMGSFLDRGDASLRLFLWRRLLDAYKAIDYPPKVVSCYLRSIEAIIKQLWGPSHLDATADHRQIALLGWLKSLDGLLGEVIELVLPEPQKAYECIDMDHLKSSISAVARLSRLLHSFALYEDSVRVGQTPSPELRGSLAKSLESAKDRLRDMQVRCWMLQYTLFKEGVSQNEELFDTPSEDCIQYLRAVHNALGVRSMCKYSNKQFLKLMKSELLTLKTENDYEFDLCQVLFDLHGIKLSAFDGLVDHGCPADKLDKPTALSMIDLVLKQARKLSIKDLCKSELKNTIDKMSQAIGTLKYSPPLQLSKRVLNAYINSPINPTRLFRAVQGVENLSLRSVTDAESSPVAKKGWYFLLGHLSLTKFRSQKRLNPVPTTDLDDAIWYFRKDIENGNENWEAWYRLAQTYDSKLEEDITWSAEKINNNKAELVVWQRNAINCYAMAVSTAIRNAEPTPETRALLSDLYTDFGIRMYSSSREPLSMGAFSLADFTRHYSNEETQVMYKDKPFREMRLYSVWNFASYLLRQAIIDKPKRWMNHYMLGKCLWKMFSCDDHVRGNSPRIEVNDVLESLLDAIDTLPQRKDSRSDPIFEPHFKLVSIIHKLVTRGVLKPTEASKTLLATPWARKVKPCEDFSAWEPYILEVLRNLKNADKSNWHHRMSVRAAHVIYDDHEDAAAAAGAKHELTQQIFTKTMTIQVWKPEFERVGRHFVYTTRYVYFFVKLLEQLDDRASLDQLMRRVRKKQGDFINHTKLWEDICLAYARVIRRIGKINEGYEEKVFRPMTWDEFVPMTARLEMLTELAGESEFLLELVRDAIELKKLNNNLMKVTMFEDLIADLYARVYEINLAQVLEHANEENKEKMKVDHLLMGSDGAADTPTPPTSAPASDAPAPRGRTKGIARRDIQKRAETIVNRKLTPRPFTVNTAAAARGDPAQTSGMAGPATAAAVAATATDPHLREGNEEPGSAQPSSVAHSLHDSADDESELSEIDDERLAKLATDRKQMLLPPAERKSSLFPNLLPRRSPDRASEEASGPASADGDGYGDEEEGEEGEEGEGDDAQMEGDGEDEIGDEEGEGDEETEGEADASDDAKETEAVEGDDGVSAIQEVSQPENADEPDAGPFET